MVHRNDPDVITRLLTTPGTVGGRRAVDQHRARGVRRRRGTSSRSGTRSCPCTRRRRPCTARPACARSPTCDGPVDVVDVFVNSSLCGRRGRPGDRRGRPRGLAPARGRRRGGRGACARRRARRRDGRVPRDRGSAPRPVTLCATSPAAALPTMDVRPVDSSTNLEFVASPFEASPPPLSRSGPASRRVV